MTIMSSNISQQISNPPSKKRKVKSVKNKASKKKVHKKSKV